MAGIFQRSIESLLAKQILCLRLAPGFLVPQRRMGAYRDVVFVEESTWDWDGQQPTPIIIYSEDEDKMEVAKNSSNTTPSAVEISTSPETSSTMTSAVAESTQSSHWIRKRPAWMEDYENPTEIHLLTAKQILRYLQGTRDSGLFYKKGQKSDLIGFTDSHYAGDQDDRRSWSTSGVFGFSGVLKKPIKGYQIMNKITALRISLLLLF
ncbi:Retrovirus-related Pol polyprotein from transposon TNT 1-94 [Senna tora]|uniref:Retrovirus-related Pol polyprotein from transposon TNT 1-94 n=1 Tax=Senna tora TaxID=362788 RepID=A0A834T0P4_9FABA|nr:Retrovirus-related Pol polyprotein from transposon TNT 1-94 [Senna tora]